ncbi:MAG TPA: type I glyceraldehyde-3-phosphate dehydrogenase [Desulfobacterales bacterium]|nr:type I glyceraldehyde-3-phosphate dehydrogenase [Desulfobacterales bacterium]
MKRIAINGLGRIGRLALRHYMASQEDSIEIAAVNDLVPLADLAYMLKYDSVHGRTPYEVSYGKDYLQLGTRKIKFLAERDPAALPWKELNVDVVIECTGLFTKREQAARHLQAGAKRVIISAPAKDADFTVVMGVNEQQFDPASHFIISNASCTTNSLAPPLKVLIDNFGIEMATVTTIHAYTATQGLVDKPAKNMIRGRAAALSLIPTSTGSDIATTRVLPELTDRLRAIAVRVPIPDGAMTDINAVLRCDVTAERVNKVMAEAATGRMRGILGYTDEPLVSIDIIDDQHSGIVHGLSTRVVQNRMLKLQVWYDNEAGYAKRLLDLVNCLPL